MTSEVQIESVYFLGAGFSKAAGIPLVAEFRKVASKQVKSFEADGSLGATKELLEFWEELRAVNTGHRSSPEPDLEEVYAEALRAWRESPTPENEERLYHTFPIAICETLYRSSWVYLANEVWQAQSMNPYIRFVKGAVNENPQLIAFITTNYDPIIEFALLGIGDYNINYGIRTLVRPYHPERASGKDSIPLLKLHGSTNWFVCKEVTCAAHRSRTIFANDIDPRWLPLAFGLLYARCPVCRADTMPLLVPPVHGKEVRFSDVFQVVAEQAKATLKAARRWVFVGFALNPYDRHLTEEFLLPALADRHERVIVEVIDPSEPVLRRFQDVLGDDADLRLNRLTFESALEVGAIPNHLPSTRRPPSTGQLPIEFPELSCKRYVAHGPMGVHYDAALVDEDGEETHEFTLKCDTCGDEESYQTMPQEKWQDRVLRIQETRIQELIRRCNEVNPGNGDWRKVPQAYERAKDILIAIGSSEPPADGFPVMVRVGGANAVASAILHLPWANPLIIRHDASSAKATHATVASEHKNSWSYLVVSRFDWNDALIESLLQYSDLVESGKLIFQLHRFEHFTLTQGGNYLHGGPRLSALPQTTFVIVECQRLGWLEFNLQEDNSTPVEQGDHLDWDVVRRSLGVIRGGALANLISRSLEKAPKSHVEEGSLRMELKRGGWFRDCGSKSVPYVKLTWKP